MVVPSKVRATFAGRELSNEFKIFPCVPSRNPTKPPTPQSIAKQQQKEREVFDTTDHRSLVGFSSDPAMINAYWTCCSCMCVFVFFGEIEMDCILLQSCNYTTPTECWQTNAKDKTPIPTKMVS